MEQKTFHRVEIAGKTRDLPLMEVSPGLRIAILNTLGDTELVAAAAKALAPKVPGGTKCLVTAEAKSIPLVYALSTETSLPYVVLRKSYKPYMGHAVSSKTFSITTNAPQTLYLDEKDKNLLTKSRALIVDDVVSTGSTLLGIEEILKLVGAEVTGIMAICTEGDREKWKHAIALNHLPLFTE